MTIGSADASRSSGPNPDFDRLFKCRQLLEAEFGLSNLELSMGMSDDFVQAIAQGSTRSAFFLTASVRVGSKIFGSRNIRA
jgi:uncharacterized pyridoxal phosphate-containing UPF0001 family protein